MFHLNKIGLIKLVTAQPYLITSSVERNLEIADFLSEQMGLLPDEIRQLLLKRPQIALTSISVLTEVWDILTSFYGIPENEARKLCVRYPLVLSKKILLDFKNRVDFFDELNMTPPFDDLQNVIIKFPALLFVDTTIFLRPNLLVLVNELECDSREIFKIISTFPQLLGYNPQYLTKLCRKAIYFLTNLAEYDVNSTRIRDLDTGGADSSLADDDKSYRSANADGYAFGDSKKADGCSLDVGTVDITSKEDIVDESLMVDDLVDMDLIADLVYKDKLEAISGTIKELYNYPSFDGLKLEKSSALSILRAAPWIISYRTERSTRILGCLMATLGLSPVELERCVKMYPRYVLIVIRYNICSVLIARYF